MDEVDNSIASQNAIVAAIGGKLKTLKMGIAASKKRGDDTILTVPPLVKGINEKLDTIKKMLDEAKNIKKAYLEANSQIATLGKERAQVSKDLEEKNKQIAELNAKIEELNKKQIELETANQGNRTAKERAEASFIALQRESAATTQRQQASLQAAIQEKNASDDAQRRALQKLSETEVALGTSKEHERKMQEHMNKLGDLKKHQADLTAALNALNAEIDSANDDMTSLDRAHVDHLGAIKNQLQELDKNLNAIITSSPPSQPPAAGSGSNIQMTRSQAVPDNVLDEPVVDADENEPARRRSSGSLPHIKTDELGNIVFDNDGDSKPNILRGTTDLPGTRSDENVKYLGVPPPRQKSVLSSEEEDLINQGLSGTKSAPSPFMRSMKRDNQRGGYIAIKKTRSKSSSSGRRGTRRRSSSSSSSTQRKRHRGTSSSSTRISRR